MEYRDRKTGATIITDSALGGDWELVENTAPRTADELKALLEENGVAHPKNAKKADLLRLVEENGL